MIRFCDVFFSLLGLIVLSPIFVIIALCIVLDSRGGVFYRQVRVGRDGKDFRLFKFHKSAILPTHIGQKHQCIDHIYTSDNAKYHPRNETTPPNR